MTLQGRRILVVEDEPLLAFAYQDELEDRGATVIVTHTLSDAMEAAPRGVLDLAILDLNLGAELSWPVARLLNRAAIPFVIVSGRCPNEALPDGIVAVGCYDKPIVTRLLVARLEALLDAPSPPGET